MPRTTCKECWRPLWHNNPLISRCKQCTWNRSNKDKNQTRIRLVSDKNKNTPAKFSKEVKEQILARDKVCIICWSPWTDFHHAYFWANANRWPNRNDLNQGVLLCEADHHEIHHWINWKGRLYRAKCIEYLLKL